MCLSRGRGALSDPSLRERDSPSPGGTVCTLVDQCQSVSRSVCLEVRVSLSWSWVGAGRQSIPLESPKVSPWCGGGGVKRQGRLWVVLGWGRIENLCLLGEGQPSVSLSGGGKVNQP